MARLDEAMQENEVRAASSAGGFGRVQDVVQRGATNNKAVIYGCTRAPAFCSTNIFSYLVFVHDIDRLFRRGLRMKHSTARDA